MGRNFNEETVREETLSPKMKDWLRRLFDALQFSDLENITLSGMIDLEPISRSTIYRYFKTKDEIIFAMVEQKIDSISIQKFNEMKTNYSDSLSGIIGFVDLIEENLINTSLYFVGQIANYNEKVSKLLDRYKKDVLSQLSEFYQMGIEEGVFKPISLDFLLLMDELFFNHLYEKKYDQEKQIKEMIENYIDIKLNGIRMSS